MDMELTCLKWSQEWRICSPIDAPKNCGHFLVYSSSETVLMTFALSRRIFSAYDTAKAKFFEEAEVPLIEVDEQNLRIARTYERSRSMKSVILSLIVLKSSKHYEHSYNHTFFLPESYGVSHPKCTWRLNWIELNSQLACSSRLKWSALIYSRSK